MNNTIPQPILLDAIRFAETGNMTDQEARYAVSPKRALGPYQFLERNLYDMGYGMPKNIPITDVQNPVTSRSLAGQYVSGYTDYHGFKTPLQQLVAYNAGPSFAAQWIANGENISELPAETQQYVIRAASYLNDNNTEGNTDMTVDNRSIDQVIIDSYLGNNMAQYGNVDPRLKVPSSATPRPALSMADINPQFAVMQDPSMYATQPKASMPTAPVLGTGGMMAAAVNQNRRDQSPMAMKAKPRAPMISNQIPMNEMLMRIGGAGLTASLEDGNALSAMAAKYGELQDANRTNALQAYQDSLTNVAAKPKDNKDAIDQINKIDGMLYDMDSALQFLSDPNATVTGLWDATIGAGWDKLVGNPDQSRRMLLSKLRVDTALLSIAQTKGAISNKEMDLFLSPTPSLTDDEQVWIDWIERRRDAMRRVRDRLSQGIGVSNPASATQVQAFDNQMRGGTGSGLSADDEALLNKYAPQ